MRNLFSRLKKKVKHLGSKKKPGRTRADVDGESASQTEPPSRPGPYIVADDGDGNGADADGQQAGSTDQPPQPDEPVSVPANGGESDQGGGEVDVNGRKINRTYSHLHPDVEIGAGGPGREGNGADGEEDGQIYSRSSTPSIPRSEEPDGALTWLFKLVSSLLPQASQVPLSLIIHQKFLIPMRALNRVPLRMRPYQARRQLPLSNYSVWSETRSMALVHLRLLLEDSAISWKIAKYGFPPTSSAHNTHSLLRKQRWMNMA